MGRLAFMMGGLIVWTAHFFGVYGLVSLGDVVSAADAPVWRAAVAGFSGLCLIFALALSVHAGMKLRRAPSEDEARFAPELAMVGAGLAAVAILWQASPAWVGH